MTASGQPPLTSADLRSALKEAELEYRALCRSGRCEHGIATAKARKRAARYA